MNRILVLAALAAFAPALATTPSQAAVTTPILDVMQQELSRSMTNLGEAGDAPLYFIQYAVTENHSFDLGVQDGGLNEPNESTRRYLDVDLRVGGMDLDSTHEIRGRDWRDNDSDQRIVGFPLDSDPAAMRTSLWHETEFQYRNAQERFTKVLANRRVKVEEMDLSGDFSPAAPQRYEEPMTTTTVDLDAWRPVLKAVGDYLAGFEFVHSSGVRLTVNDKAVYMVNTDGSRLAHANHYHRVSLNVSGMAEDGMELSRYQTYSAASLDRLPDQATIMKDAERLVGELRTLIDAPVVDPYIGPAILRNRASGVFFHEIFGHRIEGHRQKSESEGQTFTKKVGQEILPPFISVYDDPTVAEFHGTDLRGHYRYDDEGTLAERVTVVEKGILRNFLTTRSPIEGFPVGNGHARREAGLDPVGRQGNLIIKSERTVPFDQLRKLLVEECRKQGKPYGLIFDDISGGFTMTGRGGPQAFKVNPLLVRRVYADGRPDEIVRGVDIVGTPLTSFSKIIMTGDDDDVFNGTCGAESGWVPVSSVSPSILVSEIEVEKARKGQDKPPILPPPAGEPSDDPLFGAMDDELSRSMTGLTLEGMAPPYFLSYGIEDVETATVRARYGAVVESERSDSRLLSVQVRVGDPSFDNTGFIGSWQDVSGMQSDLAEEDDYASVRHQIWLHTDEAYKRACEQLAGKHAYVQTHPETEPVPDFSPAPPYEHLEAPVSLDGDVAAWEGEIREAARILREFPMLQDWNARYTATAATRRYVNSEGSRHVKGRIDRALRITATAQAQDGQRLSASIEYAVPQGEQPPMGKELAAAVREMAEELTAVAGAVKLEEYLGPVLFTDAAKTQLVCQLLAEQVTPPRSPLVGDEWMRESLPDPKLAGRLNRRVLPEFVTVTDEPERDSWNGHALIGRMAVDDEGVRSRNLTLVEDGRLVALPMSRQPIKKLAESNGRARALPNQFTLPTLTNVFVTTSKPEKDLVKELRRLAREAGNEYGLLVTQLEDPAVTNAYAQTEGPADDARNLLAAPVVAYKVYAEDGRREPVRGLVFDEVSIRTLRDIAAMGADADVVNVMQPAGMMGFVYPLSVVTPSILVEEMELKAGASMEPLPLSAAPGF